MDARGLRQGVHRHPSLTTIINQASEHSTLASSRLREELADWQERILKDKLVAAKIDPVILKYVKPKQIDIAPVETKQALVWSKLLPLIMLVWALTGAFYPAIDICVAKRARDAGNPIEQPRITTRDRLGQAPNNILLQCCHCRTQPL